MAIPDIERMYECGDILANAKGLTHKAVRKIHHKWVSQIKLKLQHQAEYEEILAGVKGADNCKRLSSQFIARFFGYFQNLMDQSIDAMLDLCEDSNVDIRKQVGGVFYQLQSRDRRQGNINCYINSEMGPSNRSFNVAGHKRSPHIVQGSAYQESS